jgi:hypothetical protein
MDATDLLLIENYIARRNRIAAMSAEFKKQCEPLQAQMDTIENEMLRRLIERGADHSATDAGTAYKERSLRVSCTNKDELLRFAFANYEAFGRDLLTANVSKETLKVCIERSKTDARPDGEVPPGLKVEYETSVRFRVA